MSDRALLPNQTAEPKQNWRTPPELFELLDEEFHFVIDGAADESNHLCDLWFGPGSLPGWNDALGISGGSGNTIFVNPPYSKEGNPLWAAKFAEWGKDNTVVALINVATSNRWWFKHVVQEAREIRFLVGRVPFGDPETGKPIKGNRYDSAVVVYGNRSKLHEYDDHPKVFWWDWKKALRA